MPSRASSPNIQSVAGGPTVAPVRAFQLAQEGPHCKSARGIVGHFIKILRQGPLDVRGGRGVLSETYKMEVGTYKMVAAAGGGHFIRLSRVPCGAAGAARPPSGTHGPQRQHGGEPPPPPWRRARIRTSNGTQSPVYSSGQTGPIVARPQP